VQRTDPRPPRMVALIGMDLNVDYRHDSLPMLSAKT
jgi:hypothetical protein